MFTSLRDRLTGIFDRMRGRGALTEDHIIEAMRDIRIALLEADVALPVVKDFINAVKEKALGQEVLRSLTPGQLIVKIVHDHLVHVLGGGGQSDLDLKANPPIVMMMVGLQGSGKTTSAAKLAHWLTKRLSKKVLMVSVDIYRPAAQEQLVRLGEQIGVEVMPPSTKDPLVIFKEAMSHAKKGGFDIVILDTAGRLHIDEHMMDELASLQKQANPTETLLVADTMTGQDAFTMAHGFKDHIHLTGVVLTRVDGDSRGGVALSMRAVTGCPIKFLGVGERYDALESFDPDRLADRILGMGDIVTLVEKAYEAINQDQVDSLGKRFAKGQFTLDDLKMQLETMTKMGGIKTIMNMMPDMHKFQHQLDNKGVDDRTLKRQCAIISAMTVFERSNPKILNASRKRRISAGSGTHVSDVNRLLKQYFDMHDMVKKISKMDKRKLLSGKGLRGLFS